jgi:hypothetical protein
MSRTRVTDEERGIEWDRIIVYLRELDCFVLLDGVRALKPGPFTLANILYATHILTSGQVRGSETTSSPVKYLDTRIDAIGSWQNPEHRALLIAYPTTVDRPISVEEIRRHYRQETGLYQIWTGHLLSGDIVPFVTVLWPHNRDQPTEPLAQALSLPEASHPERAIALQIAIDGQTITLGAKLDLGIGILKQDVRPRYGYDPGRIHYGDVETDAVFFYVEQDCGTTAAAFVEGTRLVHQGKALYEGKPHRLFQEDGSDDVASPTWRERWETTQKA